MTNARRQPAPPPSRPVHRPSPPPRDRRLARAHDRRRGRERPALLALVPELRGAGRARPTRAAQRALAAFGTGARAPDVVVFHTAGDAARSRAIPAAMRRAAAAVPGARTSSYFSTGNPMYLSRDRHTTFQVVYPPGAARLDRGSSAERIRAAARAGLPAGIGVDVTGRDALDEATKHGAGGGSSVLVEARDRRDRRAGRPAVRVRDAARGPDAARRRRRGDLQHLHARVGADLRHERLDHRPVPDRPGRARHRDRLRAADDHALPRGDPGARRRRDGARRDRDPRGPLGDRLRLDRRHRPAGADRAAAAARPVDGHRRHADPARLGARLAHAAARPARGASARASTACR